MPYGTQGAIDVKFWEVALLFLAALLVTVAVWMHLYRSRPLPPPQAYQHFGEEPRDRPVSRPVYDGAVDYNAR
jgi:hypothetical protein